MRLPIDSEVLPSSLDQQESDQEEDLDWQEGDQEEDLDRKIQKLLASREAAFKKAEDKIAAAQKADL